MLNIRLVDEQTNEMVPGASWTFNRPAHIPDIFQWFQHAGITYEVCAYRWHVITPRAGLFEMGLDLLVKVVSGGKTE